MKISKLFAGTIAGVLAALSLGSAVSANAADLGLGDPSGDGIINAVDASYILSLYADFAVNNADITQELLSLCDVNKDGSVNTYEIETEQEHLYDALAEKGLVGKLESGYFIELDGETAVTEDEEWWGYTRSGEYVNYGVGECVIKDGEHYEFTFNVGW